MRGPLYPPLPSSHPSAGTDQVGPVQSRRGEAETGPLTIGDVGMLPVQSGRRPREVHPGRLGVRLLAPQRGTARRGRECGWGHRKLLTPDPPRPLTAQGRV